MLGYKNKQPRDTLRERGWVAWGGGNKQPSNTFLTRVLSVSFKPGVVPILGRSEVLRSLRRSVRAQSQGHHIFDRQEERGVERGSARRSSLKGRERSIVSQSSTGLFQKQHWGTSERRSRAYGLSPTPLYHLELNWMVQKIR